MSTPTTTYKLFIFDTGTTGTTPSTDAISDLALIEYHPASPNSAPRRFSTLVKPWFQTSPPQTRASASIPKFPAAWDAIQHYLSIILSPHETPLLVAHNAPFDTAFLQAELQRANLPLPCSWRFADSLPLVRTVFPHFANSFSTTPYAQSDLADRFEIEVLNEHHAKDDVRVLREILITTDQQLSGLLHDTLVRDATDLQSIADTYVSPEYHDTESFTSTMSHRDEHPSSVHPSSQRFITTRTGAYYHLDQQCRNLRFARKFIFVSKVSPQLKPCYLCVDDNDRPVASKPGDRKADNISSRSAHSAETNPFSANSSHAEPHSSFSATSRPLDEPASRQKPGTFITTRSGNYFHKLESCQNLRFAKKLFHVSKPAANLKPCHICCSKKEDDQPPVRAHRTAETSQHDEQQQSAPRRTVREKSSSSSLSGRRGVASTSRTYITTRTGRFYHMDTNCKNLRSAKARIPVKTVPPNLRACYLCCPDDPARVEDTAGETIVATSRHRASTARQPRQVDVESASTDVHGSPRHKYITTRTGRYYHLDRNCRNLKSAKKLIGVDKPDPQLIACYICSKEPFSRVVEEAEEPEYSSPGPSPTRITSSKVDFRKTGTPKVRYETTKVEYKPDAVSSYDESKPLTKESSLARFGSRFVKTSGGKKFHLPSCRTVKNSVVSDCRPAKESRDPCRVCLLELFQEWEVSGFND